MTSATAKTEISATNIRYCEGFYKGSAFYQSNTSQVFTQKISQIL